MKYQDIKQFPHAGYEVDVPWEYLEDHIQRYTEQGLDIDPDFQRGHVWTEFQQVAFVEHMLRGGKSPRHIYFNCSTFKQGKGVIQLIDGKQRLEAARRYLRDDLIVFGSRRMSDLGKKIPFDVDFRFHIHVMSTRKDVLTWYLGMNTGGSVHSQEEVQRVRVLLSQEGS